jgi:hypothetical protein
MGHLQFCPRAKRPKSPSLRALYGAIFADDATRLVQRHASPRASLTTLKSLFRGNAATPHQFTITLAIRGKRGDL